MARADITQKFDKKGRLVYENIPDEFGYGLGTEGWANYDDYDHKVYEKLIDDEGVHEKFYLYNGDKIIYQKNIEPNYVAEYTTLYLDDVTEIVYEKFARTTNTIEEVKIYKNEIDSEGVCSGRLVSTMDLTDTRMRAERVISSILESKVDEDGL